MKKLKRAAALFMTSVFALSAFCVTAGALDGEGEGEYAAGESSAVDDSPVSPDYNTDSSSDYNDSGYADSSSYSDYAADDSSYDDYNSYSSSYSDNSYDYSNDYGNSDSVDYNTDSYNSYDYNSSSSYNSYDGYNGYDNNDYGYAGDYASSQSDGYNSYDNGSQSGNSYYESATDSLIQSEDDIDDSTLSNNDWSDIAKALSSAGSDSDGDDADDFSFIKNNTSTGDNGHWMLYVSIALLVTSFIGIAYFVGSTVLIRKRAAAGRVAAAPKGGKPAQTDDYGAHAKRMRSDADYGDNYSSRKGAAQKHRKYDTAEIRLSAQSSSNGSGGRRYRE